jgi:hypothetical protein
VIAADVTVVALPGVAQQFRGAGAAVVDTLACPEVEGWFEAHGCTVAVVRPDRYVYGTTGSVEEGARMIRELTTLYPAPVLG